MTAQLIVKCPPEYLDEVRKFADQSSQRQQFESRLSDLTAYLPDGWTVELYTDFAPYSFFWTEFSPTGQRGLIGGLIYHGQHDGGGNGGAPTFSVSLEPCQGWAIHT
jgi:hypothetical protein